MRRGARTEYRPRRLLDAPNRRPGLVIARSPDSSVETSRASKSNLATRTPLHRLGPASEHSQITAVPAHWLLFSTQPRRRTKRPTPADSSHTPPGYWWVHAGTVPALLVSVSLSALSRSSAGFHLA